MISAIDILCQWGRICDDRRIVFFNASRQLPLDIEREIRAGINDGVAAMSQHVKVENIGIAAILDGFTAAETGLAGWHFGPDACILWIDEENSNLGTDPRRRSATAIAHEYIMSCEPGPVHGNKRICAPERSLRAERSNPDFSLRLPGLLRSARNDGNIVFEMKEAAK